MRAIRRFLAVAIACLLATGARRAAADPERWRVPADGPLTDPWRPAEDAARDPTSDDAARVRDDVRRVLSWRQEQIVSRKDRLYGSIQNPASGSSGPAAPHEARRARTASSEFEDYLADERRGTELEVEALALPALRAVMDAPSTPTVLRAACALALAKAASSDEDVARLLAFAAHAVTDDDPFVAATSVIALGALAHEGRQPACGARSLDAVRRWLRGATAAPAVRDEVRGLSLLALGLLAASAGVAAPHDDGEHLLAWALRAADLATRGDAWTALTVVPAARRPAETRVALRAVAATVAADAAAGRELGSYGADVLLSLGALGDPADAAIVLHAARARRGDVGVRRAAWTALAGLATRATAADAAALVVEGRAAWPPSADPATDAARILATGDLARTWFVADQRGEDRDAEIVLRERTAVVAVARDVLALVEDPRSGGRAAAGVALGEILDGIGDRTRAEASAVFREEGIGALRDWIRGADGAELVLAARAYGRGWATLSGRGGAEPPPRPTLAWTAAVGLSRAYAAEYSPVGPLVLAEALEASGEPAFGPVLATATTRSAAFGLRAEILRGPRATTSTSETARWIHVVGELAARDDVAPLVAWLSDARQPVEVRAAAAAALGVVADLKIASSWSRFGALLEVGAMSAARERALRAW